jgi:glucosamine--fructose-6-phosphate aminotransferase (isomerizing)
LPSRKAVKQQIPWWRLKQQKRQGAIILGVVNVVGSSIARVSDAGAYTHAGPEIGVASTKAFTAQLAVLTMIALKIAHQKGTLNHNATCTCCRSCMPSRIK